MITVTNNHPIASPTISGEEDDVNKPKFEAIRTTLNGKVAIELVVRNSMYSQELHQLIESLGYEPTVDMANRRSIFCLTPAAVDAARNPIAKFFDAKGEWK